MIGGRLDGQDLDLEAWEFFARSVVLSAGAKALEAALERILEEEDEAPLCRRTDMRPEKCAARDGGPRRYAPFWDRSVSSEVTTSVRSAAPHAFRPTNDSASSARAFRPPRGA